MLSRGKLAKISRATEELENQEMVICSQLGLPEIEEVTQVPAGELQNTRARDKQSKMKKNRKLLSIEYMYY